MSLTLSRARKNNSERTGWLAARLAEQGSCCTTNIYDSLSPDTVNALRAPERDPTESVCVFAFALMCHVVASRTAEVCDLPFLFLPFMAPLAIYTWLALI